MATFIDDVVHRADFYAGEPFQQTEHRTPQKALR